MAIPSKQIGWGTESNLLWQIAKQIQYLTQVTGTSLSSFISQTVTSGVTDKAPSEDAVYNALLLKQGFGKIKLTDPNGVHFNELSSARAYVQNFTSNPIFDESFDVQGNGYFFSTTPNTSFGGNEYFCDNPDMNFQDPDGLVGNFSSKSFLNNKTNNVFGDIVVYDNFLSSSTGNNTMGVVTAGDGFLRGSSGNNTMGNVTAGYNFLQDSTGNNTMGDVTAGESAFKGAHPTIKNSIFKIQSCDNGFAHYYQGRMDIGLWGNDEDQNLPIDIFTTSYLSWIRTPYSNQFVNGGTPDLDVSQALSNLQNGNLFSTVIYE